MSTESVVGTLAMAAEERPDDRLAALFDAHHERIYRLARRLTPCADDALDLVQETFLRAARAPASVPTEAGRAEAWLVRVVVNVRRDQWRRTRVRKRYDHVPADLPVERSHHAAVAAGITIWRALDGLPPRRRAVVVMHELEGLAVPVIARQLGISSITVRWHLSAGRRDLIRLVTTPARKRS